MSINLYMEQIGKKAKHASQHLSGVNIEKRNSVLKQFSQYLKTNSQSILNSNKKDLANAKSKKIKDSMLDRLKLDKFKEASLAFSPIFFMYKFFDILYFHQVIFMNNFFSTRISQYILYFFTM